MDCPGYGDSIDSTAWIDEIKEHLRTGYSAHYEALGNPPIQDSSKGGLQHDGLVHVCLYFIAAHRLKGVDLEFMRRLEPHVNLVPIIAKADTMTLAERDAFRRLVLSELKQSGVNIFKMNAAPGYDSSHGSGGGGGSERKDGGQAHSAQSAANGAPSSNSAAGSDPAGGSLGAPPSQPAPQVSQPRVMPTATTQPPPFAICASEDGTRVYPWGTCCVEDPAHSDLSLLRSMLFASSMIAAKRKTLELYEACYARERRAEEARRHAYEGRALRREMLLGRMAVLSVASTSVAIASLGALKVFRPDIASRIVGAFVQAVDQPGEAAISAMRSVSALLTAAYARVASLKVESTAGRAAVPAVTR